MIATSSARADRRALIILIVGASVIGLSPVFVKLAEASGSGVGPSAVGFWRLGFALPVMLAISFAQRGSSGVGRPDRILFLGGLFFAADLVCWHYGIRYTSVANATVLSNLTPIFVTLAAFFLFRERPGARLLAGLAVAVAGAVGLSLFKAQVPGASRASLLGDGLSILTAVWYSGYFLSVREARKRHATGAVMLWTSLLGLPVLIVVALALGERITPLSVGGWWALFGLGMVHVTGQGSIAWALGRLPASLTAVVVLVQPVVATILGWLVFSETITLMQGASGVLALAGVALAQAARTTPAPVDPQTA